MDSVSSSAMEVAIDVVIRTPGKTEWLERCLKSLKKQVRVRVRPIIVLTKQVEDFQIDCFPDALFVADLELPFNYSRALNTGFAVSSTPYVLSFSSHCEFIAEDALFMMAREFDRPEVIAVTCETPNVHSEDWAKNKSGPVTRYEVSETEFNGYNGLSNACGMIRRADWQLRHFQEDVIAAEDQEWAMVKFKEGPGRAVFYKWAAVSHNPADCMQKLWRDRVVIAARIYPPCGSWKHIARDFRSGFHRLLEGRWKDMICCAGFGLHTARYRITGNIPKSSSYGIWKK